MAVASIRRPADFILPADAEQLAGVLKGLSDEDRITFTQEVLGAMASVKSEDDFRPVVVVVERWYRSALLRQHPGWPHALEQADAIRNGKRPRDVQELNEEQLRREVARRRRARSA
jgi:hypothetical protein